MGDGWWAVGGGGGRRLVEKKRADTWQVNDLIVTIFWNIVAGDSL